MQTRAVPSLDPVGDYRPRAALNYADDRVEGDPTGDRPAGHDDIDNMTEIPIRVPALRPVP